MIEVIGELTRERAEKALRVIEAWYEAGERGKPLPGSVEMRLYNVDYLDGLLKKEGVSVDMLIRGGAAISANTADNPHWERDFMMNDRVARLDVAFLRAVAGGSREAERKAGPQYLHFQNRWFAQRDDAGERGRGAPNQYPLPPSVLG